MPFSTLSFQISIPAVGNYTFWRRTNKVNLVGFVDVKAEILKEQASQYSISPEICFAGLDRAIEEVQADAVVNVTSPAFHKAVNFGAFEAGLHVLSEKSLSDNYKDCLDIVRKAR